MSGSKRFKQRTVSRRTFLARSGAAAVAGALTALDVFPAFVPSRADAQPSLKGKSIRILTWTDKTGQAAVDHIAKPFAATTGANVIPDLTGFTSEMVAKLKASKGRPQYDVVTISGVGAIELAKDGLLEKPDITKLPNLARVPAKMRIGAAGFGIGYFLWSDGLVYSTKAFTTPPNSWEALWDKNQSGKLFLANPKGIQAMELTVMAARLAGGNERNPEPGFRKLEELKGRVLTLATTPPQTAELFRTSALSIGGPFPPLLLTDFIAKPEYAMSATLGMKEGFFADLQFTVIPKGHPGDDDAIHAFINYTLDPAVQGTMAETVWYGPINQDAKLSAGAKQSPFIVNPATVGAKAIKLDLDYLATVRQTWIERYTGIFG